MFLKTGFKESRVQGVKRPIPEIRNAGEEFITFLSLSEPWTPQILDPF